jgi:chromosome segregation ATPase
MGRKAFHTQEQVFAAADQLATTGRDVTASGLLALLGGGSLTTIYKHLELWEASRKDAPRPVVIDMPEAVSAAFMQAWQAAAREAGKEIVTIREKTDAEVKTITKRFEEALSNIERLEVEANADAATLEGLTAQLAEQEAALARAGTEKAALAATVEQMRQQIEAQQAELERVHKEAEAERQERQLESKRLLGDLERERSARQEAIDAADRHRQAYEQQGAELAGLAALLESERQKGERSKAQRTAAEAERDSARQEANTAREETARWRGQAEALQSQNIALVRRFTPTEEATTTPEKPASQRGKKEI